MKNDELETIEELKFTKQRLLYGLKEVTARKKEIIDELIVVETKLEEMRE